MFNVRLAETRSGGTANEDVVGHIGKAAWVIDGASGVGENLVSPISDAQWFAQSTDRELRKLLADQPDMRFEDLFLAVVERCAAAFAAEARRPPAGRHEMPSAAIAFVRALSDRVEMATLGDCEILYRQADGDAVAQHGDGGNVGAFEALTKASVRDLVAANPAISSEALFEAMRPQLVRNRAHMNVDGGYWVLGLQPEAVAHADRIELPHGELELALASDGFLRLSDMFDRIARADMLAIERREDFDNWYGQLRDLEQAPGSLASHPRAKMSDDASFVRIDLHTNSVPKG